MVKDDGRRSARTETSRVAHAPNARGNSGAARDAFSDDDSMIRGLAEVFDDLVSPVDDRFLAEAARRFQSAYDGPSAWTRLWRHGSRHIHGLGPRCARLRRRVYRSRFDRVFLLGSGSLALAAGLLSLVTPGLLATSQLLSFGLTAIGFQLWAFVIQSGRTGLLSYKSRNQLGDLASNVQGFQASLDTSLVRGHEQMHDLEKDIVERARRNLLTIESWHQPRMRQVTPKFAELQKAIRNRLDGDESFQLRSAVSTTATNWHQCRKLLESRLERENVTQQYFATNPLQLDVILSEGEALLSFPKCRGGRVFGIHIQGRKVVDELREILTSHIDDKQADSVRIETKEDILRIDSVIKTDRHLKPVSTYGAPDDEGCCR